MPWAGPCWVCEAVAGCLQAQTFFNPSKTVSHIEHGQEENVTAFSCQREPKQVRNKAMRSWGGVKEEETFPLSILRKAHGGCRRSSGLSWDVGIGRVVLDGLKVSFAGA